MQLNKGQQLAVEQYAEWYKYPHKRKRPWFEISGAAGTGKTTVVKEIMDYLEIDQQYALFLAFVGKATLALRLAGVPAYTIHSKIYELITTYKRDKLTGDMIIDPKTHRPIYTREFSLKSHLDKDYIQLVADEAGMIGKQLGRDVLSFGIPLICLGDLNQLPPVMDQRIFLSNPDVTLTEIMRQEKDSPIIYLSQLAINRVMIPYGTHGDVGECVIKPKSKLTDYDLATADIVLCETNQTRDMLNNYIRKNICGIEDNHIVKRDKLICKQNRPWMQLDDCVSLVNGLIGYVDNTYSNTKSKNALMEIDFQPEFYQGTQKKFKRIPIKHDYPFYDYSQRKAVNPMFSGNNITFEFAHAITCHLAQGSQYDNVLVYLEHYTDSLYFSQWLYTAITRAKKKLTIVY